MCFAFSIAQCHCNRPAVACAYDRHRCIRRGCAVLRALTVHGQAAQGRRESVVNGDGVACFSACEDVLPCLDCADRVTCGFCVSGFALVGEGGVQCYGRAGLSFRALRAGITFFALWPLCTLRATLALNALWALLALRPSLALWASVTLVTLLAFEVSACNAVLQLLQTVSGFLSALVCIARTGGGFIGSRLRIGLGLLCGGGIGVHGIHQLLPCRGARFRLCAILCA